MPIYVVNAPNQRVRIPNQALAVSINGSVGGAELDLRTGAEQPVVRPTAHHAVLPRITGEVTIGVRPVGAPRFGPGTVIHLAIAHDNPAEVDPVQVLFDPVDVSGDSAAMFAVLRPQGSHIEVGISTVADVPLSPLGSAARSSARQVIGRGPAQSGGSVVMALDVSASMRPWFADGSAAAATDIVVGGAAGRGTRMCGGGGAPGAAAVVRWGALVAAGGGHPHYRLRRLPSFRCAAGVSGDLLVQR